jgi:hypothetical protein
MGLVAHMKINAYRVYVRTSEANRLHGRLRYRWVDNNKVNNKGIE